MTAPRGGPPPLRPFGLVLHHDGRWSHEGHPILNRKLREHFDRSVKFLPDDEKFVVTLRHFRGEIIVEEAAFFVREVDLARGSLRLSDGSEDLLEVATLTESPHDGAWLCRVKRELATDGLLARFTHAAQAELSGAIEFGPEGPGVELAGAWVPLPDLA